MKLPAYVPVHDRRTFLQHAAGWAAGVLWSPLACVAGDDARRDEAAPSAATAPNLLFIMADDLGYADLGIYGRRDYATPALDRLAREGVRLTQAYAAAPICSPTRVALMTGRYPARLEVGLHEPLTTHPIGLPASEPTLSRALKQAGYETALIGKWHLGLAPEFHPLRHGFDQFYGHLGAAVDYATGLGTEHLEHDWFDGTRPVSVEGYATELLTERAVDFITRPRSAPWFLSLQYNAPHWPWQAPGDAAYPDSLRWAGGGSPETYAAMMRSLDDGVARVLNALSEHDLENDTLVIFTSDNGGERFSDMGPLRDRKFTLWEGGIRVAAMARWPGVIPSDTVSDQVAITMDWTATLLAAAGVRPGAPLAVDGMDLLAHLRGTAPVVGRELFWRLTQRRNFRALRAGDWKYVVDEEGREHLFDLAADPGERRDLRDELPDRLEEQRARYARWEADVLPPVPLDPEYR